MIRPLRGFGASPFSLLTAAPLFSSQDDLEGIFTFLPPPIVHLTPIRFSYCFLRRIKLS